MPKVRAHVAIRFLACRMPSLRITPTPCVMLMPSMVVFALRRGGRLGPWCPKSNHRAGRRPRCAGCRNRGHQKIERVRSAVRAHYRVVRPRVLARSRSMLIVWMRGDRLVAHGLDMTEVNAPSSGRHGGATSRGPTFACEKKIGSSSYARFAEPDRSNSHASVDQDHLRCGTPRHIRVLSTSHR